MPQHLERALHRAVLAEAAVQRDEHAREAVALQLAQVALGRIERVRVHALARAAPRARALPDMSEISRSADGPPISTATLPNSAHGAIGGARLPDDLRHFGRRARTPVSRLRAPSSRTCSISASMSAARRRAARVDDEVRVLLRHARAADRVALEAAGLDQARRVVAGRIAEHAAGVRQSQRLRRDALARAAP